MTVTVAESMINQPDIESFEMRESLDLLDAQFRPYSHLIDQTVLDAATLTERITEAQFDTKTGWLSADDLGSLRAERALCDEESLEILNTRIELVREGEFEQVPYAFNTLTKGYRVLEAEELYGVDSEEYREELSGLDLNCVTHMAEANNRLGYVYFDDQEQSFSDAIDSFVSGGDSINDILDNGLSPIGSEEVGIELLIADRREERTSNRVFKLARAVLNQAGVEIAKEPLTMLTITQLKSSPQTVIRGHRFDPVNNRRFHQQVGFTKEYITHEVITEGLKRKGVIALDAQPTEKEVNDKQALSPQGENALDFMELLDTIASEKTGLNIFMGGEKPADFVKDYSKIPTEAIERQATQKHEALALREEILRLCRADTDGWLGNSVVDAFVTNMLLDKVSEDPGAARSIFGEKTAQRFEESIRLRQQGDIDAADQLVSQARLEAPSATVCTGGQCGLENGSDDPNALVAAKQMGGKKEDLLKDIERVCSCGGTLFHDQKLIRSTCVKCGALKFGKNTVIAPNVKKAEKKTRSMFALAA